MKPGNSPTVSPFIIDIPNDSREVISIGSTRVFEYWLSFSRMCLRSFNMMISFVVIEFVLLEDLFITNLVIYQYIPFFLLFSIPKITPINGKNHKFFQSVVSNKFVYFGEYWYDNGGLPSILVNYLKTHELNIFDYLDKNKSLKVTDEDFKNPTSLTTINQNVLMCQTGYLTLRSSLTESSDVFLGIPNGELYKALNKLLATKFFKGNISVSNANGENILNVGTVEDVISLLNTMVNTVTYDAYPLNSESSVQNYVKAYLLGAKQNVFSEVHQAKGRADLMIETNKRRIVIEFKYAQNETEAKAKLSEAIEQIKSRDYGNIVPRKNELLRIAAVFNADPKVRAFTQYKFVQ